MNRIARSLVLLSAVAAAGSASADFGDMSPYIGLDYYHAWMKGKDLKANSGAVIYPLSQMFPKSYPGVSLYAATKFHEYFGVEVGVGASGRKKRTFDVTSNGFRFQGTAKVRRSNVYADLFGFLPLNDCVDLLGSIGIGWVKPKVTIAMTGVNANDPETQSINGKGRAVLRLGVGASYMVTDMIGVRAKIGSEFTSGLRLKGNQDFQNAVAAGMKDKGFKSSMTASVGAFIKF